MCLNGLPTHIHDLPNPPTLDVHGQWVHLRNAKTATTSMDEGPLRGRCIMQRRGVRNWEVVWRRLIVPRIDDVMMFTFVRNPWDRVLAAFIHCRDKAKTGENKIATSWDFTDWVKEVLAPNWPKVNRHFASQYDSIYYDGKPIPRLFVGRFECLEEDWRRVADRLGVSRTLPKWNAGDHKPYTSYYDDETRNIIGRLYAPEIEALGYEYGT